MVAFNTALIFYYVEAIPAYDSLVSNIFNRVAAGELEGWTSVISLREVLVQPIVSGRNDLQRAYRELLLKSSNFHTVPINVAVGAHAARIPSTTSLLLPYALPIALRLA